MSVIEDIYNGAYYPAELVRPDSDAFREHLQNAEKLAGQLERSLSPEQREILDDYKEETAIVTDLYNMEFFRTGVQLGVRLLLEALGMDPSPTEQDRRGNDA